MNMNTLNRVLPIKNRVTPSNLKYVGLMRFALSALCVPFLSFGQTSLKAQDADVTKSERSQSQEMKRQPQNKVDEDGDQIPPHRLQRIIDDCTSLLSEPDLTDEEKALHFGNRGVFKFELGRYQEAIQDYTAALALSTVTDDTRALILHHRAISKANLEQIQSAIADFKLALLLPGITNETKASTLYNRGNCHFELERYQEAIADYTAALALSDDH